MPPKSDILKNIQKKTKGKGKLAKIQKEKESEKAKYEKKKAKEYKKLDEKVYSTTQAKKASALKTRINEEEERRTFFKKLDSEPKKNAQDLANALKRFSAQNPSESRAAFIRQIIKVKPTIFYWYITDYLNTPPSVNSRTFFEKYINSDAVKEYYKNIDEKKEPKETDEFEDFFGDFSEQDDEDEIIGEEELEEELENLFISPEDYRPVKTDKRAKMIEIPTKDTLASEEEIEYKPFRQEKGKIGTGIIPEKYQEIRDRECIQRYLSGAWLGQRIVKIWLNPVEINDTFYEKNEKKMIKKETYYRASSDFINAQCNLYKRLKSFNDSTLMFFDSNKEPQYTKIAVELENGDTVPYTKELFNKQVKYMSFQEEKFPIEAKKLLNRKIEFFSRYDISIIKRQLVYQLSLNLDFITDMEKRESYSTKIVDSFFVDNDVILNSVISNISSLLAIFSKGIMTNASLFKEKVKENYYTPKELSSITIDSVFPEIFLEPENNKDEIQKIDRYLQLETPNIYRDIVYSILYSLKPGMRKTYIPRNNVPDLTISKKKNICSNDVSGINPYAMYIYKEDDGSYYCFDLENLDDDFLFIDKNEIDEKILQDMLRRRDRIARHVKEIPENVRPETEKPRVSEKYNERIDSLTDSLVELILDDIAEGEEELGQQGEDYREIRGLLISEKDIEIYDEKIEDICTYCQKHIISDNPIKSLIKRKDGSKVAKFCDTACFDKMQKWPKYNTKNDKIIPSIKEESVEEIDNFPDTYSCAMCKAQIEEEFPIKYRNKNVCGKCYSQATNPELKKLLNMEKSLEEMEDKYCAYCLEKIEGEPWRSMYYSDKYYFFDSLDHFLKFWGDMETESGKLLNDRDRLDLWHRLQEVENGKCECDEFNNVINNKCTDGRTGRCDKDGKCVCTKYVPAKTKEVRMDIDDILKSMDSKEMKKYYLKKVYPG